MALRCTSAKGVRVPCVRANAGVQAKYHRALMAIIRDMDDSLTYWLRAEYRKQEPKIIAQDSAADFLQSLMDRLTRRWRKKFDELSKDMATRFVTGAQRYSDTAFASRLRDAGFTVRFRPTPGVREAIESSVNENVLLIKSIGETHLNDVAQLVQRSVAAGRDLGTLTNDLQERYGITSRRAAFIARDQNNKATATINRTRQMELGLTEAIWVHSGAGRHPRPSHLKAWQDRLRYNLKEGALIDGKRIFPGELPNCRCTGSVIIPGYND